MSPHMFGLQLVPIIVVLYMSHHKVRIIIYYVIYTAILQARLCIIHIYNCKYID